MQMKLKRIAIAAMLTAMATGPVMAQAPSHTWNPNLPGGKYRNPVIDADYSDPDVCRVGNDYYMTASSFACFPGLQILHSTDLVNWEIIGAALKDDYPVLPQYKGTDLDFHKRIEHGNYVWAPSIRYHDGWFYIYWGDPDQGLFMTKTQDPRGTWETPVLVKEGKGMIDCCPLWDDDGKAYLSHGCAGSRAGVKSVLFVAPMSPDGTHVTGPSRIVYDGHEDQPTIEGTKFYKRNGYYYIMSPAGGVKYGWQVELRSKNPFGPYDEYVGLAQGKSKVNGPHQGAWVDTQNGEDWFLHFQDKHAYGRVVHLQPAKWVNDWLVIGDDTDGHIDTLARLCPGDTIAYVSCSDSRDSHYEQLKALETELQAFRTLEDKPYRLVPLPLPDPVYDETTGERLPATYANFLILNHKILLPTYAQPDKDKQAHDAMQRLFPKLSIIDIDSRILISQHGSIHCATMQFPQGVVQHTRQL